MNLARPVDAYEVKFHLYRWWATLDGGHYAHFFMNSVLAKTGEKAPDPKIGANFVEMERHHLYRAPVYWVSPDMLTLAEKAAETIPAQPLQPNLLPSPLGFVGFGRDHVIKDVHGCEFPVRAVHWMPGTDSPVRGDRKIAPITGIALSVYTPPVDGAGQGAPLSLLHATPWAYGEDYTDPQAYADLEVQQAVRDHAQEAIEGVVALFKFLDSLWTLMGQRVSLTTRQPLERKTAKRLERKRFPVDDVHVVTLRRARPKPQVGDESASRQVDWRCRWIVGADEGGFWRQQWYPSEGRHRRIWVEAYEKGPAGKPLKVPPVVRALKR